MKTGYGWEAEPQYNRLDRAWLGAHRLRQADGPPLRPLTHQPRPHEPDTTWPCASVRMEASAEFYSVPKIWFLGLSRESFQQDTWARSSAASTRSAATSTAISRTQTGLPGIDAAPRRHARNHSHARSAETDPPRQLGIRLASAAPKRRRREPADTHREPVNRMFSRQLLNAMGHGRAIARQQPAAARLTGIRPCGRRRPAK